MNINVIGIDLAKNVFHVHGVDRAGKTVMRKKLMRAQLSAFIAQLPPCLIGMEACGSAHYWARQFQAFGHTVKLMSPQFVKPYVKSNKNDTQDAEAICEAVTRPSMRFVAIKTVEQQDIQSLHRIRSGLVQRRTALANQIRGLLNEYGIIIPQGITQLAKFLPLIIENTENRLTVMSCAFFAELYEQFITIDKQIKGYTRQLEQLAKNSDVCQRMMKVPGVGSLTATALIAAVNQGKEFKKGREMAAWLGLVPRQHSTGGKSKLLGISKRALANKNARILWALLSKEVEYQAVA
jgi:transposase